MTLRRLEGAMVSTAIVAATTPNSFCRSACDTNWAVRPPSTPPAAVAISSTIPNRRLMRLLPAWPAVTALEVAMTAARLTAAAAPIGNPRPRLSSGTRNTAPAAKMISARNGVTTGNVSHLAAGVRLQYRVQRHDDRRRDAGALAAA